MSEERITTRRLEDRRRGETDWARVDALTDAEIEAAVAEDPDAAPLLDEEFWKSAELVMPAGPKERVTLRLDADVLDYFRSAGRGYQTRINAVLRAYVRNRERGKGSRPAPRGRR